MVLQLPRCSAAPWYGARGPFFLPAARNRDPTHDGAVVEAPLRQLRGTLKGRLQAGSRCTPQRDRHHGWLVQSEPVHSPSAHLPVQTERRTDDLSTRVRFRRRPAGGYVRPGTEFARELEFGGGWFQFHPLAIDDIGRLPVRPKRQPRVDEMAERADGLTMGVTPVLGHVGPCEGNEVVERAFFTCGHATWRRHSGPLGRREYRSVAQALRRGPGMLHVGRGVAAVRPLPDRARGRPERMARARRRAVRPTVARAVGRRRLGETAHWDVKTWRTARTATRFRAALAHRRNTGSRGFAPDFYTLNEGWTFNVGLAVDLFPSGRRPFLRAGLRGIFPEPQLGVGFPF